MKFKYQFLLPWFALVSIPSQASSFYFEAAGGISSIRNGTSVFGSGAPAVADYGAALNLGMFYNFGGNTGTEIQLGINGKYTSGASGSAASYSLFVTYPEIRLQLSKVFLGVGISPLIYTRNEATAGLDQFNYLPSSLALLGELGFLWPVTPKFSLGLTGSVQSMSGSGASGPIVYDISGCMRFYFGFTGSNGFSSSSSSSSSNGSSEFQGWRYPFGNQIK